MNCNNLNSSTPVKIEPIGLDLSQYYGQSPNGNWAIIADGRYYIGNNSGIVNAASIELCTRQVVSTLSVNDTKLGKDVFQVYPNPSNGQLNVLMKKGNSANVHIFDTAGRLVHTQSSISNDTKIDLRNFAKGSYLMVFDNGIQKSTKKVIIK